jgi:hypothetical protein
VLNGISATASLTLDVNGYVTGYRLVNNGTTSSMTFAADNFSVVNSSGSPLFRARSNFTWGNGTIASAFESTIPIVSTNGFFAYKPVLAVSQFGGDPVIVRAVGITATDILTIDAVSGVTTSLNVTINGTLNLGGNILGSTGTLFLRPGGGTSNRGSLDSAGNLVVIGNVSAYSSDMRLKENVRTIEDPIGMLRSFGGYTFDWKMDLCEEVGFTPTNKHEHGVLAQEILKVVPDAVGPAGFNPDYYTVKYDRLVPVLVEAIKQQQDQIEHMQMQLNALKKRGH